MKIAFFTADAGNYGSARSLATAIQYLQKNNILKREEITLICSKSLIHREGNVPQNKIFQELNYAYWVLPFSRVELKGDEIGSWGKIKAIIKNLIAVIMTLCIYKRRIRRMGLDYIHINSLTLWPLLLVLPHEVKTIIHIREILDEVRLSMIPKIARKIILIKSSKIIAIDNMSAKPFINRGREVTIIKNPFDMRSVEPLKAQYNKLCKEMEIDPFKIHIALIGNISPIKGHTFFLDLASRLTEYNDIEFLVVGDGAGNYAESVKSYLPSLPNIKWLGFKEDMDKIYVVTDIVMRCEDFLPLGRTVWEGYYAGCSVLLPICDGDDLSEIKEFINKGIYTYKARDVQNARETILAICSHPDSTDIERPFGNVTDSVELLWNTIIN